jgi:hypothetical protein
VRANPAFRFPITAADAQAASGDDDTLGDRNATGLADDERRRTALRVAETSTASFLLTFRAAAGLHRCEPPASRGIGRVATRDDDHGSDARHGDNREEEPASHRGESSTFLRSPLLGR